LGLSKLRHEEVESKFGYYKLHSVQNVTSFHLLSKSLKVQNHNITCFLYGCETWSVTPREEFVLKAF